MLAMLVPNDPSNIEMASIAMIALVLPVSVYRCSISLPCH